MWAILALFILYLAALAAGVYEDGMNLFQFMAVFPDAMDTPLFSALDTAHCQIHAGCSAAVCRRNRSLLFL